MDIVHRHKVIKSYFGRIRNVNSIRFIEILHCLMTTSAEKATKLSLEVNPSFNFLYREIVKC